MSSVSDIYDVLSVSDKAPGFSMSWKKNSRILVGSKLLLSEMEYFYSVRRSSKYSQKWFFIRDAPVHSEWNWCIPFFILETDLETALISEWISEFERIFLDFDFVLVKWVNTTDRFHGMNKVICESSPVFVLMIRTIINTIHGVVSDDMSLYLMRTFRILSMKIHNKYLMLSILTCDYFTD